MTRLILIATLLGITTGIVFHPGLAPFAAAANKTPRKYFSCAGGLCDVPGQEPVEVTACVRTSSGDYVDCSTSYGPGQCDIHCSGSNPAGPAPGPVASGW